jgi:membrane protease YdiL (CAAX protease family)
VDSIPLSSAAQSPWVIAAYGALALAVVSLWLPRVILLRAGLMLVALACGYVGGVVSPLGITAIVVLAAASGYYGRDALGDSRPLKIAAGIATWVGALLLGMHLIPGFSNVPLVRDLSLSPASTPYTQWLNFDKNVVGLLLLTFCYRGLMTSRAEWKEALRRAVPLIVANIAIVVALAFALGFVRFDPKWNAYFPLWAAVNLLFTCMAEEAFFRGLIQRNLQNWLQRYRAGTVVAIGVSAVLFGLAHFGGGIKYVLLASVAGLGYALVFWRTGRIEMSMLANLLLNATHFLLLTYPRAV